MRILFVHEVDWAAKPVFELHEFPERLAERGHEVVFLDYRESAPGPLGATRRSVRGRSRPSAVIELISVSAPLGGILGRLLAVVVSWWVVGRLMRTQRFDVVVLYGVPTNGWSTCWWGRRLGTPVVYRAIDVAHRLRWTRWSLAVRLAERYVARSCTHVSSHNTALMEYLVALAGPLESRSIEIPGVELVSVTAAAAARRGDVLADRADVRSVILYRGTLYRFSGVAELIDLLAPLLRRRPEVHVLVVGEGESRAAVEAARHRLGLAASVTMTRFVPHAELGALFEIASVSVNPFVTSLVTDCALPARVLQSLRAGTPCVSTPLAGLRATVPSAPLLSYRALGPAFVDEIERWLDLPAEERDAARRATAPLMRPFDWDVVVDRFDAMLARAAGRR